MSNSAPTPAFDRVIEITVSPTGEATVQTKGFTGQACRDASRLLERALGDATAEKLTAEFFQAQAAVQRVGQG